MRRVLVLLEVDSDLEDKALTGKMIALLNESGEDATAFVSNVPDDDIGSWKVVVLADVTHSDGAQVFDSTPRSEVS